jgi:hypothetical protein
VLVAKLVELLRPGITSATDNLSTSATDQVLEQLRAMLKDEEETAAAAGGGGEAAAEGEVGQGWRSCSQLDHAPVPGSFRAPCCVVTSLCHCTMGPACAVSASPW